MATTKAWIEREFPITLQREVGKDLWKSERGYKNRVDGEFAWATLSAIPGGHFLRWRMIDTRDGSIWRGDGNGWTQTKEITDAAN